MRASGWSASNAGGHGVHVPVSQLQLLHRTQHSLQITLLILQHQRGQPLQHQRHIEHQNSVTGSHMPSLEIKETEKEVRNIYN